MTKPVPRMPDAEPGIDRGTTGKIFAACAECGARQLAAVGTGHGMRPLCALHYAAYWSGVDLPARHAAHGARGGAHRPIVDREPGSDDA